MDIFYKFWYDIIENARFNSVNMEKILYCFNVGDYQNGTIISNYSF